VIFVQKDTRHTESDTRTQTTHTKPNRQLISLHSVTTDADFDAILGTLHFDSQRDGDNDNDDDDDDDDVPVLPADLDDIVQVDELALPTRPHRLVGATADEQLLDELFLDPLPTLPGADTGELELVDDGFDIDDEVLAAAAAAEAADIAAAVAAATTSTAVTELSDGDGDTGPDKILTESSFSRVSAARPAASQYQQFPTGLKLLPERPSQAPAPAAAPAPAVTPGYSAFPTGAAAMRHNLESLAAGADGVNLAASPQPLGVDARAQLQVFLDRKHILSDDDVSLQIAQADAPVQHITALLFNDWLLLVQKSKNESQRIMLGDCFVQSCAETTLKLSAVLSDSDGTPVTAPAAAPAPAATTASRSSARRSQSRDDAEEADEALPKVDVYLTFANAARAVEWGSLLNATIEEWKKKNDKKKKGGIKGFMQRLVKKGAASSKARAKEKPQVPDSWRPILEASGITDEQLNDPDSMQHILAAVDEWSTSVASVKKANSSTTANSTTASSATASSATASASTSSVASPALSPRTSTLSSPISSPRATALIGMQRAMSDVTPSSPIVHSPARRVQPAPPAAKPAAKAAALTSSAPGELDSPKLNARGMSVISQSPPQSPRRLTALSAGASPPSESESPPQPRLVAAHARNQYVQIPVNANVTAADVEAEIAALEWPDVSTLSDSGTFDELALNETLKRAMLSIDKKPAPVAQVPPQQAQPQQPQAPKKQVTAPPSQQQPQQPPQQPQAGEQSPSYLADRLQIGAQAPIQAIDTVRQCESSLRSLTNQMLSVLGSIPPNEQVTVQRLLEQIAHLSETYVGASRAYGQQTRDAAIGARADALCNDVRVRVRALASTVQQLSAAAPQTREAVIQRLYAVQNSVLAMRDFICDEPLGTRFPFVCAFAGCTRAYELAPDLVLHCRKRHVGQPLTRPSQGVPPASELQRRESTPALSHTRQASGTVLIGNAIGQQAAMPMRRPSAQPSSPNIRR
jgi:hypothetical protein